MSYLKGLSCLIDLNICYNIYDIGAQHLWRPATSWLYLHSLLANNGRSDCIPCLEQPVANEHLVRYHFERHPSISAETIKLSQTESVGTADHRDHRCVCVHPSENQPFPLVLPRLDIVTRRETNDCPFHHKFRQCLRWCIRHFSYNRYHLTEGLQKLFFSLQSTPINSDNLSGFPVPANTASLIETETGKGCYKLESWAQTKKKNK